MKIENAEKGSEEYIKEQLRNYIIGLNEGAETIAIADDTNLLASNYLDSLTLVEMVSYIEKVLDKKIDFANVSSDNFNSINSMYDSFFK